MVTWTYSIVFIDGEEVNIPFMNTTNEHTRKPQIWDEGMNQLRKFKEEHGHSEDTVTLNDPELGAFALYQRWNYKRFYQGVGGTHKMTEERDEEWKELNFTFPVGKRKVKSE